VSVNQIRRIMRKHIGSRVKVKANRGRHKIDVTEGVIIQTYPSIFLIQVDNAEEQSVQHISFSYTDVITKDVCLSLCD
ncbi:MAG: Veg family protein, partial [Lachnospiraceae bacterium]|nr:Veg family protein [Lachnospiraceae bacterium]